MEVRDHGWIHSDRPRAAKRNETELGFEKYDQNQVSESVLMVLGRRRSNRKTPLMYAYAHIIEHI